MKDNRTEELQVTAEPAEAEEKNAAAELGKFKDVKALMEAYNALEAEFTRRSQRLKELEANKEQSAPVKAENAEAPSPEAERGTAVEPVLTEEMKNAVITQYLNGVRANRGVPIISGGGAVTAVRRTPTDVREAGALAKKLFDNKEDR